MSLSANLSARDHRTTPAEYHTIIPTAYYPAQRAIAPHQPQRSATRSNPASLPIPIQSVAAPVIAHTPDPRHSAFRVGAIALL